MKKITKILFPIIGIASVSTVVPTLVSCSKNKFHYDINNPKWSINSRGADKEWNPDNATEIYFNEVKDNIKIFAEDVARDICKVTTNANASIDITVDKFDAVTKLVNYKLEISDSDGGKQLIYVEDIELCVKAYEGVWTIFPKAAYHTIDWTPEKGLEILNQHDSWKVTTAAGTINRNNVSEEGNLDLLFKILQEQAIHSSYYLKDMTLPTIQTHFHYEYPVNKWNVEPRSTSKSWDPKNAIEIYLSEVKNYYEILAEDFGRYWSDGAEEGSTLDIDIKNIDVNNNIIDFSIENNIPDASDPTKMAFNFNKIKFSMIDMEDGWTLIPTAYDEFLEVEDEEAAIEALINELNKQEGWSIDVEMITDGTEVKEKLNANNISDPQVYWLCFASFTYSTNISHYLKDMPLPI